MSVLIETNLGDFSVDLNYVEAPLTCYNFLKLCKLKFYHNCKFHKVESNFVCQAGLSHRDGKPSTVWGEMGRVVTYSPPTTAVILRDRMKDFKKTFPAEVSLKMKHDTAGLLCCGTNGRSDSMFFITLKGGLNELDGCSTVFGRVSEGFEEMFKRKINRLIVDPETKEPSVSVRILSTHILVDPFPDPPDFSSLIAEDPPRVLDDAVEEVRSEAAEVLYRDETDRREAQARGIMLEILGDVVSADAKPDDAKLFICNLHPETSANGLETIFSRFGELRNVQVVRHLDGRSKRFGFLEYESSKDAEAAFFKMNDKVIDSRKVTIDFCQSTRRGDMAGRPGRRAMRPRQHERRDRLPKR